MQDFVTFRLVRVQNVAVAAGNNTTSTKIINNGRSRHPPFRRIIFPAIHMSQGKS